MESKPTYRIHYRYRQWIGKPDRAGFGTSFVYSNDPSWIQEKAAKLKSAGHQILQIQKLNSNGSYRTL